MPMQWTSLVGSRWSVSPKAWALVTPVGVVAAPLAAVADLDAPSPVARLLLVGLVAQLPLGVVLLLGGALSARMRRPRGANVLTTVLAGAARGFTIAIIIGAPDTIVRTVASAITMAIWLQVIGAALESHERYEREVAALLGPLVARELQGRLLDDAATHAARAVSAPRIAETSGELRAIVVDAADDHERTAALLQGAIETRLRPLSHDLWFSPRPVAPHARSRSSVLRRIISADVPATPLFVAALVLLTWGSFVLHGTWQGALVGVAVAVTYGAVLAAAQALRHRPTAAALVRYVGTLTLPAIAGGVAISAFGLSRMLSTIAVALGMPMITFGIAAAITLSADRAATLADLRARLAEPDWDRHLGELVRREVDAHAATTLHNSVQPALTAAALQLQLAAALDDPERAREALDRASRALDDAERHDDDAANARGRLLSIAEAWQGIAAVELHLPSSMLSAQEWSLLADVVGESVANAVRHGHANTVSVRIDDHDSELVIVMSDNGYDEKLIRTAGLGTTWLGTVVESSHVEVDSDGTRTTRMELVRAEATQAR